MDIIHDGPPENKEGFFVDKEDLALFFIALAFWGIIAAFIVVSFNLGAWPV